MWDTIKMLIIAHKNKYSIYKCSGINTNIQNDQFRHVQSTVNLSST